MATIVEMINPLTGLPEQVDKLDHTAQEIDDAVGLAPQLSNPNLLDNWYFGNPINQRGQTSYTGVGYGIDRWTFDNNSGNATILITDDGIKFVNNSAATGIGAINQKLPPELYSALAGKTVTLSILGKSSKAQRVLFYVNDAIFAANGSAGGNNARLTTLTATLPQTINNFSIYVYGASEAGAGEGYISAAKLELGSQQTIAHQDENGNWQLNEIPDYGEQLARCQRYFQLYSSADLRPAKAVDCRPTMRADPSQSTIVVNSTTYYYNTADL